MKVTWSVLTKKENTQKCLQRWKTKVSINQNHDLGNTEWMFHNWNTLHGMTFDLFVIIGILITTSLLDTIHGRFITDSPNWLSLARLLSNWKALINEIHRCAQIQPDLYYTHKACSLTLTQHIFPDLHSGVFFCKPVFWSAKKSVKEITKHAFC